MLAACKAALSGLSPSAGGSGGGSAGRSGRSSPVSDKQVEAFVRALSECRLDAVEAHLAESRCLLVCPLRCHPARSTAWHLAAGCTTSPPQRAPGGGGGEARCGGSGGGGGELLQLLLRLYGEQELPREALLELINAPNKRGQSCLHTAAAARNGVAVRLLLGLGCELMRVDKCGRTALHHAAAGGSEECVRLLLEAEAEAAADDTEAAAAQEGGDGGPARSRSTSPHPLGTLSSALPGQQQQQSAAATIVSRLAGAADVAGLTPLHFAAAANSLPIVRLLLAAGSPYSAQASADNLEASMPCNAGWTCLHVAAMRGHLDVALRVLCFHTSLSSEEQMAGWTPSKHCRSSDPRVIVDRRGTTAHSLAATRGFVDLAALLDPATPLSLSVGGGGPMGPEGQELVPPAMFLCPITQELMRDPVVASDGFTYERAAISRWVVAGKRTSPMTNLSFTSTALYPNNVIKSAIKEWRQEHRLPDPDAPRRSASRRLGPLVGLGNNSMYDVNNAAGFGAGGGGGRDPFLVHLRAHGL